jgi:NAD+ synthase
MKTEAVIDYIVHWLTEYCEKSGLNGFVVGISGGIDSAVTSTLCAKTGKTVCVLSMPVYPVEHHQSLAAGHIQWLKERFSPVTEDTVDLSGVYESFRKALPEQIQDGLVLANLQSRLRMAVLYAYAGHHRLLVAGTGNKVEDYGVGFFTKYGDGGVDIAPIADLLKSEVRMIARAMGVLTEIVDAVPTDGLWADSRSDEAQIGASYDELERAMDMDRSGVRAETLTGRARDVLAIYRRLNRANRHKVEPVPVAKIPGDLRH